MACQRPADRRCQLFTPSQPLFIPGQLAFIYRASLFTFGSLTGFGSAAADTSVFFDDERHFRAGGHTVADQLRILGWHFVFFEDRIARLVDREQVWIDCVALGVAHAFRLFETNPHEVSSSDGSAEHANRSLKSRRLLAGQSSPSGWHCRQNTWDIGVPPNRLIDKRRQST
jgi:hypothetical protein